MGNSAYAKAFITPVDYFDKTLAQELEEWLRYQRMNCRTATLHLEDDHDIIIYSDEFSECDNIAKQLHNWAINNAKIEEIDIDVYEVMSTYYHNKLE